MADKRPSKPPPRKTEQKPKPPVDGRKPYWRHGGRYTPPPPPLEQEPALRERRRLAAPGEEDKGLGMKDMSMSKTRKGLGLAINKRPVSEDGAKTMPYTPGTGSAKTMPYTPGTGSMQKMPYRPKPKMKPMSYDNEPMDSLGDAVPPGYADTMEYVPERDGDAWGRGGPYDGSDPGFENMGKQEENQKWKYDNWRSEEGRPIPEDQANVYNDLFDEWNRKRPDTGENANPTEVAQWERSVRRSAAEAGLSEEEIDQLVNDLYDLD